jgi:hypothetical protein
MIGRFGIGSQARAGAEVRMRIDTGRLHFFDLESEAAIGAGAAAPEGAGPMAATLEA